MNELLRDAFLPRIELLSHVELALELILTILVDPFLQFQSLSFLGLPFVALIVVVLLLDTLQIKVLLAIVMLQS